MKTSQGILGQYSAIFLALFQFVATTPTWYSANDGNSYLIEVDSKFNWLQAYDECARRGLQLAVIDNAAKNRAFDAMLRSLFQNSLDLWLGHHDEFNKELNTNRPFYSVATGEKLSFNNWKNGEPNNGLDGEHCAHIFRKGDFTWNDAECHNAYYGYICEEHFLNTQYRKDMSDKRLTANQKNSQISSEFLNTQNELQEILANTRLSTDNVLLGLRQSSDEILAQSNQTIHKILLQKPYLNAVIADIGDLINEIVLETYTEILKASGEARQSIDDVHLGAENATSSVTMQFAVKLANNANEIDKLLVY